MEIPRQMQAMAVDAFGGPDSLTLHTLPVPQAGENEVLVRVEVAGVGVWDAMEREGDLVYNEVHFPRVLGGESAGTVVAVGEGVELKQANGFADRMLLDQLNTLIGIGDFKVHIAQTFALQEAAHAQEAMDEHYLGKIVLRVSDG